MIADIKRKLILSYSLLGLLLGLVIFFLGITTFLIIQGKKYEGRIYPNVYLNGKNIGNKTKLQAMQLFQKESDSLTRITITVIYQKKPIAYFTGQKLRLQTDATEVIDRAYLIGRSVHFPTLIKQRLGTLFNLTEYPFSTHIVYDKDVIDEFIDNQEEQYNYPAKNALFEFQEGKVVNFKPDEKGLKLNSDKFREELEKNLQLLQDKIENKQVILTSSIIESEITLAKANNLGIEELIGEGSSNYTHSIPSRIHNVVLAASKFHGILISKGATFSFNNIVGDISSSTGYEPAYIIKNGKTVLGDGGGVCQVSTTIFRTALNSGLPIIERHAHAYRVSYYENDSQPGFDATVYGPTVDLKFVNNTPGAILIQMENDPNNLILIFKFYGKKDNRIIEISKAQLWDVSAPPPPLYQDDPTLPKGETKQIDFPAWGGKARFSYKVYKENKTVIDEIFYSSYRPWQAVYLVGQG